MNTRMIGFVLGRILLTETGLLTLPLMFAALPAMPAPLKAAPAA